MPIVRTVEEFEKMLEDPKDVVTQKSKKLSIKNHLIIALSEYFGTTLLVFLSCLGTCSSMYDSVLSSMHTSFTAGLAVTTAIQTFAHLSGAHVNPAVSLNAVISDQISLIQLPSYILPQILGSLSGAGLFAIVTDGAMVAQQTCVNSLHSSITTSQGLVIEIILSVIMNLAICGSWDRKNADKLDSVSLRIGLLVVVLNLAAGVYTGASMNPSRSFGPAVIASNYTNHWIYWTAPITGAVLAGFIYRVVFV